MREKRQQGNKHGHSKLLNLFNYSEDFWFFRFSHCVGFLSTNIEAFGSNLYFIYADDLYYSLHME